MKIIKDNEELKSYVVNGVVSFYESIECDFDICLDANIEANNIKAHNIQADNIQVHNIDAHNIEVNNIEAHNIEANNIEAGKIQANKIQAHNIDAHNIDAYDIKANKISYYAFCIAYNSLKCLSIEGKRANSVHKCLDNEIEIKKTEINLQGKTFKLSLQELNNLKEQLK